MAIYAKYTYKDGHIYEYTCEQDRNGFEQINYIEDKENVVSAYFSTKCSNYSDKFYNSCDLCDFEVKYPDVTFDGSLDPGSSYDSIVNNEKNNKKITFTENCKYIRFDKWGNRECTINLPTTTELVFEGEVPPTITNLESFNAPNLETIYVPKGSEEAYKSSNFVFANKADKIQAIPVESQVIDHMTIKGEEYEIADAKARKDIEELKEAGGSTDIELKTILRQDIKGNGNIELSDLIVEGNVVVSLDLNEENSQFVKQVYQDINRYVSTSKFKPFKTINGESIISTGWTRDNIEIKGGDSPWEAGTGVNSAVLKGGGNTASGDYSVAEGRNTTASGICSHAEGSYTNAKGVHSHAEGWYTTTNGDYSHAEGQETIANGTRSHAEGYFTTASGDYSHAEGRHTNANGERSHAEGFYTNASGQTSHAEGDYTKAIGIASHAEGSGTNANGDYSHAEGNGTNANGNYSHAEGNGTNANGNYSHAEGYGTSATTEAEHASGWYNVSLSASTSFGDSGNTLFTVGNGTSSLWKHNAFQVMQNGDIYIADTNAEGEFNRKPMIKLQDALSQGGGGSVDAYTKVESDARYAPKDEFASVSGDVENALGDIAALENDKQNKLQGDYVKDVEIGGSYINFNSMKFDGNNNGSKSVNFKTINNQPIFGAGNIDVSVDTSNLATKDGDLGGLKLKVMTQSQYDGLGSYDSNVLYIING